MDNFIEVTVLTVVLAFANVFDLAVDVFDTEFFEAAFVFASVCFTACKETLIVSRFTLLLDTAVVGLVDDVTVLADVATFPEVFGLVTEADLLICVDLAVDTTLVTDFWLETVLILAVEFFNDVDVCFAADEEYVNVSRLGAEEVTFTDEVVLDLDVAFVFDAEPDFCGVLGFE